MTNSFFSEYVDPFDGSKKDFILKAEHLGRYLFAKKIAEKENGSVIYDIACGNGYGTRILAEKNIAYGFDRMKNQNTQTATFYNVHLDNEDLVQSVDRLHIKKPDCIVCFETLEHLKEPKKLLQSFYQLLPSEGRLIISVPNAIFEPKKKGKSRNKFHLHLFYYNDIVNLLEKNGFSVHSILGQGCANILVHKVQWILPILDWIFLRNRTLLTVGTGLIAWPSRLCLDFSYSIILVAQKTNK